MISINGLNRLVKQCNTGNKMVYDELEEYFDKFSTDENFGIAINWVKKARDCSVVTPNVLPKSNFVKLNMVKRIPLGQRIYKDSIILAAKEFGEWAGNSWKEYTVWKAVAAIPYKDWIHKECPLASGWHTDTVYFVTGPRNQRPYRRGPITWTAKSAKAAYKDVRLVESTKMV